MGLFTRYCAFCGNKIEKTHTAKFGKHFDSEEHAQLYAKQLEDASQNEHDLADHPGHGCGC